MSRVERRHLPGCVGEPLAEENCGACNRRSTSASPDMKPCCQFAAGFRFQHAKPDEPWDEVLFESANFVAMPTRGSLVEGWLLVVPKEHHYCVGAFAAALITEFQLFRREVQQRLESIYGSVVAFEHGAAGSGRPAGCGVDHAHLHLVPWSGSFAATVTSYGVQDFEWQEIDDLHTLSAIHQSRKDYLFFEERASSIDAPRRI